MTGERDQDPGEEKPLETRRHKQMRTSFHPSHPSGELGGTPAPVPPRSCPGEVGGEVQTLDSIDQPILLGSRQPSGKELLT